MSVLEREWEAALVEFCRSQKIQCRKLKLFNGNAWPDRTLLYRGHVMFMELKKEGEKLTPLQMYVLDELQSDGFYATWSDNLEEAKREIMMWKEHVDDDT